MYTVYVISFLHINSNVLIYVRHIQHNSFCCLAPALSVPRLLYSHNDVIFIKNYMRHHSGRFTFGLAYKQRQDYSSKTNHLMPSMASLVTHHPLNTVRGNKIKIKCSNKTPGVLFIAKLRLRMYIMRRRSPGTSVLVMIIFCFFFVIFVK